MAAKAFLLGNTYQLLYAHWSQATLNLVIISIGNSHSYTD